jgi:glycosyltransferase involved in cell wall biosynthesis
VIALHTCADVFVSLHRAEGLGLAPLEAMQLGRCVIATAWSGSMDYMDQESACLVDYTLVPTAEDPYYMPEYLGETAFWAEPEIAHAAHWMRRLAGEPELRARKGAAARAAAQRFQESAARADFARELRALYQERQQRSEVQARYLDITALAAAEREHAARVGAPKRRPGLRAAFDRYIGWRLRHRRP